MSELKERQDGLRLSCPGCGGGLRYNIGLQKLECDRCASAYDVEDIRDPSPKEKDDMMEATEFRCPQCGAAVHGFQTTAVTSCAFCGSDVVLIQRLSSVRRPDRILPFRITREKCEKIYRERLKTAVFAPAKLLARKTVSRFQPLYIPFWRYSGSYHGPASGESTATSYTEKEITTSDFRHTLRADVDIRNVYYDASSAFDDETALRLCLRTKGTRPFHPGYLCGCFAEAPDVPPSIYMQIVRQLAGEKLSEAYRRSLGLSYTGEAAMDSENDLQIDTELVLLPVWLLADRQRSGQILYTAINGSTGEIVCDTPVSYSRFALLALGLSAAVFAVLLLLDRFSILRAKLLTGLVGALAGVACWMIGQDYRTMLLRKSRETDPSRAVLRDPDGPSGQKIESRMVPVEPPLYTRILALYILCLSFMAFFLFFFVKTRIALVNAFVSNGSVFPAMLMGTSAYALFDLKGYLEKDAKRAGFLYYLLMFSTAAIAAVLLFNIGDQLCYLFTLWLITLLCVLMVRVIGNHNKYVTRPVPIFSKEVDPQ